MIGVVRSVPVVLLADVVVAVVVLVVAGAGAFADNLVILIVNAVVLIANVLLP